MPHVFPLLSSGTRTIVASGEAVKIMVMRKLEGETRDRLSGYVLESTSKIYY